MSIIIVNVDRRIVMVSAIINAIHVDNVIRIAIMITIIDMRMSSHVVAV